MPKQSGSIDLTAEKEASQVATTYITRVTDAGIKVHAEDNPTTDYVSIDATGMEVVQGGDSVAKFGASARVGLDDESHIELDYHSMKLVDKDGSTYLHVSDLRDSTGYATISAYFRGDGTTTAFDMLEWDYPQWSGRSSVLSVSVDGVEMTYDVDYTNDTFGTVTFFVAPASGSQIVITYRSDRTSQQEMRAFTFGTRDGSSALGMSSISFGDNTTASGYYSFAQGYRSVAQGMYSHSEGYGQSEGLCAHSEGGGIRRNSHAASYNRTEAIGDSSHAEGYLTRAAGTGSHAEGYDARAGGDYSHAQNIGTVAAYEAQTAIGKYNSNKSGNAFEVGNGTSNTRSNAFEVGWDGNVIAGGNITASGNISSLGNVTASGHIRDTDITAEWSTLGSITAATRSCRRSGNVVTITGITIDLGGALSASASVDVGTVPADYRPKVNTYAQAFYSSGDLGSSYFRLDANGKLTFRAAKAVGAAVTAAFTMTFVV